MIGLINLKKNLQVDYNTLVSLKKLDFNVSQPFGGSIKPLKAYSSIIGKVFKKIGEYLMVHFTTELPQAVFSGTFL